ncbi:phage tail tape measure protein [Rhodopila sp.]|uniref:phage tail tape measure protein n=1 Tax=Rhodopila sp. TaxID=2480087 RepID=UPI003D0A7FB5
MAEDVSVKFGASIEGVVAGVNAVKEQLEGLAEFSKGVQDTFTELGEAMIAAFAIEKIDDFLEHITDLGLQVERTAQQIGLSVEQVSLLQYAASLSDVSLEELRHGLERFSVGIQDAAKGTGTQAAAFETLGISVRNASGQIKPLDAILTEVMDAFGKTADGGNKTAVAMMLFGRQGADLIPVLDRGSSGLEDLKAALTDTGAAMTTEMDDALAQTKQGITNMHASFQGVSNTLFEQFKPAIDAVVSELTFLAQGFVASARDGGTVSYVLTAIEVAIDTLITAITGLISIFDVMWDVAKNTFLNIGEMALKTAVMIKDAATFNMKGASEAYDQMGKDMAVRDKEMVDNATNVWTDYATKMKALWQHALPPKPSEDKQPKPGMGAPGDHMGKEGDKDQMQAWQAELDNMLIAQQIFGDKAKQVEEDFWKAKLATADKGSKEYNALVEKVYSFENQEYQKDVQATIAAYDQKIKAAQGNFAQVEALENKKLAYLLQIYGKDAKNYQDELRKKQQMDNQHVQQEQQKFQQFFNSMFSGFNSAITGMIKGTETFGQAVASVMDGMLTAVLGVLEKWAEQQLATLIFGETSTQAAARANIAANAAQAGAGAYAATAAIPYVGPILAPAAAATAYASALAYEGLASYDVGAWKINSDHVAMVHAGETIMPASAAEAWRQGQSGAAGGGDIHVHIQTHDAKSFQEMLRSNPDAIASAVRTAHRNGNSDLRAAMR